MVDRVGFENRREPPENPQKSTIQTKCYRHLGRCLGHSPAHDPRLTEIVLAWSEMSDATKSALVALVRSVRQQTKSLTGE